MQEENKQRMLITGVSGLLGNSLAYYFKNEFEILGLYNVHPVYIAGIKMEKCDLSLSDSRLFKDIIKNFTPSTIIHCASLTNIEQCESEPDIAYKTNVISTKNIVEEVQDKNVRLVYISSDSVYDGMKGNFVEDDNINPQNYYGLTKYEGELEALKLSNPLILRTNIFGWNIQKKESIGEWVLNKLQKKQTIDGFKDVYFSTIYTMKLAQVIDISIEKKITGIFNCGSSDSCSKYEFALKLAECFGLDKSLVNAISIDNGSLRAKRGKNMTLNVKKIQRALNYKLPKIDNSIEGFYRDIVRFHPDTIASSEG
jgi:dTDP-4-dehydrorhamnose reductase